MFPRNPVSALPRLASALVLAAAVSVLACSDSKMVTSPATGNVSTNSASVAGTWSGSYAAFESNCGGSSAIATFQQTGATVTGSIKTADCGVSGSFVGTMEGNTLMGALHLEGCTGGGVSGTLSASGLALSIGDMTKPLVTGDRVLMSGGSVTLHR
jgi:hypothetical protein